MKQIPLTKGKLAIVDDHDAETVSAHRWFLLDSTNVPYAVTFVSAGEGRRRAVLMHRLIMGAPDGMFVHHVNGDGLDNRRCNLRIVTNSQNQAARRPAGGASLYRGVTLSHGRWVARIKVGGRWTNLGAFDREREAAEAYDRAALQSFGEFARLNFPEVSS